jgi:hypothetical protein
MGRSHCSINSVFGKRAAGFPGRSLGMLPFALDVSLRSHRYGEFDAALSEPLRLAKVELCAARRAVVEIVLIRPKAGEPPSRIELSQIIPHQITPAAERETLVRAYQENGLTQKAFAKREGAKGRICRADVAADGGATRGAIGGWLREISEASCRFVSWVSKAICPCRRKPRENRKSI